MVLPEFNSGSKREDFKPSPLYLSKASRASRSSLSDNAGTATVVTPFNNLDLSTPIVLTRCCMVPFLNSTIDRNDLCYFTAQELLFLLGV
jgi:hypothetical protein